MLKTAISERTLQRAQTSLEQAKDDLKLAKELRQLNPQHSGFQSAQAAINALSSVLESQGFFQLPSFSTVELLDRCVAIDPLFDSLRPSCYILDGTIERDAFGNSRPRGIPFTPSFARACYQASQKIVIWIDEKQTESPD